MVVVGYSPAQGQITNIIVKSDEGRYQTLMRNLNWYISDGWLTQATADLAFSQGFVKLPKPIELGFFLSNLSQFE